jgi:crotonobetainyl-CoA:carnitine CoA-transferase CaiB-like acyl-CoA transferase
MRAHLHALGGAFQRLCAHFGVPDLIDEPKTAIGVMEQGLNVDELAQKFTDYFAAHHGEVVYPSDLAMAFGIDYEQAVQIVEGLEKDGKIKKSFDSDPD